MGKHLPTTHLGSASQMASSETPEELKMQQPCWHHRVPLPTVRRKSFQLGLYLQQCTCQTQASIRMHGWGRQAAAWCVDVESKQLGLLGALFPRQIKPKQTKQHRGS